MSETNWYNELKEAMTADGEDFEQRQCTLTDEQLKEIFNNGYGGHEGAAFTAWGAKWVYFPLVYDGSEWVGHAPRNPCDISMNHQGEE